jgi:cysteine-rich repeat protein
MIFLLLRGALLALPWLLVACSSEGSRPRSATAELGQECVPNRTLVCLCGLDEGTQEYTEACELTPCKCSPKKAATDDGGAAKVTTPCGNGRLDSGEACDDGNTVDGDGCSARCTPDGAPPAGGKCPGQPVTVWPSTPVNLAGATSSYAHRLSAGCYPAKAPERIYAVTPAESGTLSIDASFASEFYPVLSVRADDCAFTSSEVMCEATGGEPLRRVLPVEKGHTYYLVIDGELSGATGSFAVRLELL